MPEPHLSAKLDQACLDRRRRRLNTDPEPRGRLPYDPTLISRCSLSLATSYTPSESCASLATISVLPSGEKISDSTSDK